MSWKEIEEHFDIESSDSDRWQKPLVIKIPGSLRKATEEIEQRTGMPSSAMTIGRALVWLDIMITAAETGKTIKFEDGHGVQFILSNDQLRTDLGLLTRSNPDPLKDFLRNPGPNPGHPG